jgi:tocopherol O-methyltransferase
LERLVRFRVADCSLELPARDGSVDVVYSIEAACQFTDKEQFVRECARVLKPAGRLALSDWMAADGISAADYAALLAPVCRAWHLAALDTKTKWRERFRQSALTSGSLLTSAMPFCQT